MAPSTSSTLLFLYITSETIRATYAYHVFTHFPQVNAALITLVAEILKLIIACLYLLRLNNGYSLLGLQQTITSLQTSEKLEFKKIVRFALPAGLYLINNLIYYTVLPKTSPSLLQVCILAKLPTTGLLHHYLLKPQRNLLAWISLAALCVGLAIFNIPSSKSIRDGNANWWLAPVAGFVIAWLSAWASIATEKITKTGEFWESQALLYLWGSGFAVVALPLFPARSSFDEDTNLLAVGSVVGGLAIVTSITGLIVAVVLRARDNILKLIGTAASLITIAITQFILLPQVREGTFSPWRVLGGGIVTISTWCYNCYSQEVRAERADVEAERLLEDEKAEKGSEEAILEDEQGVGWLRPNAVKVICCAIFVGFMTVEVALRTP
jgi:UDP-sugar transporter A1/2/3